MITVSPIYVRIKNFLSYEDQTFYFKRGSYGIIGLNNDSNQRDKSNGSGKTGIGEAVLFCQTGRTFKGLKGDDIVREGQKNCLVKYVFKINNKIGYIESGRKPNVLRFYNGKRFIKSNSKPELQKKIMDFFGLDYDIITRFFIIGEKEKHKFSFLGSDDKTIKDILTKLTNSSIIDEAQKVVFNKTKKYEMKFQSINSVIETENLFLKDLIYDKDDLKIKISKSKNDVDVKKEIKDLEDQINKYEIFIRKNSNRIKDFTVAKNKIENSYEEKIKLKEKEIKLIEIDIASIKSVNDVKEIKCPHCNEKINIHNNKVYDEKQYRINRKKLNNLQDGLKVRKDELKTLELYEQEKSFKSLISNLESCQQKKVHYEDEIAECEDKIKKLKIEKNSELKMYTLNYIKIKKDILSVKKRIEEQELLLQHTDKLLSISRKFLHYFGKEGMKNFLFSKKLKLIEHFVNNALEETNTDMTVKLSGMTKLKSGKWNQKISGTININGKDRIFEKLSKGEARIIDLAFIKALSDLFNFKTRSLLRIFDEPFGGLDNKGKTEVINMLKNMKDYFIYIISPESNLIRNNFYDDEIYLVTKENGISVIQKGDYK